MSHFRCSCPEKYRFACSLKNLNLFPPIYSQKNYWGSVEGSSLEFWVLLPTIMMCNQLISVKCISAMAWGWDTSLVPRSSLRLSTHTVSCCFQLLLGQCRYRRGVWGSPWPQPEGPVWQETSPPSGYAHLGYELGLHCCFVRPGSCRSWPRLPKGSGLQALSSEWPAEGNEAQIS